MTKKNKNEKKKKNISGNKRLSQIRSVLSHLKELLHCNKSDKSNNKEMNAKEYTEKKYSNYITKVFNSTIIHMLIVYLNKNKEKLKKYNYAKEQNFINKFAILIKELYLNEIEVAYLTLLLDKVGWNFKGNDHWVYFYCLGIYAKKKVTGEYESDDLLSIKDDVEEKYADIINDSEFYNFEKKGITNKEINDRFKELTKPINSYCRKNFINYCGIADKIVRLSQPYGKESNGNQLFNEKKEDQNNNNDDNKKNEELEYSKLINNISRINNNNNYDYNQINNLGSINVYNTRNTNLYNPRQFTNLNLSTHGSNLSLNKGKSSNYFSSGGDSPFG